MEHAAGSATAMRATPVMRSSRSTAPRVEGADSRPAATAQGATSDAGPRGGPAVAHGGGAGCCGSTVASVQV